MKNWILELSIMLTIGVTAFLANSAWASNDFDSEEYAPVIKKSVHKNSDYSIFDETRIHLGVALLQSFQNLEIAPGVREQDGIRGFQLGLGVDLFSQNWQIQGVVMAYPASAINDTTIASNGFELRILHDHAILEGVTLHEGAGLGNRYYSVKTVARPGTTVTNQEYGFNSGAAVLVLGAEYWPSGEISGGVEVTNHIPIASGSDPSSIDLAVQITGHF